MNVPGNQIPLRRYRRRILGWGAVGVFGVFAVGAAIFGAGVENDLERRVVAEFNNAQVGPVTASFSGQNGTLLCPEGAVDVPNDLLERSRALWGVSSLNFDKSCTQVAILGDDVASAVSTTEALATTESEATLPSADAETVASLVATGSQFSTLQGLLEDTALDATLAGDGPFTLFAPTNEAFQALGPDAIAALGRDTELLITVLSHHVTAAAVVSADLRSGVVEMLDESSITVEVADSVTLTSGASKATVTEPDLIADNGVVHAIDHVLLPVGMTIGAETNEPILSAEVADGQIFLSGTVATDSERAALIKAAGVRINPANVVDDLIVDPGFAVIDADVEGFANLASLMVPNLVSGQATLTSSGVTLIGVYATDEQNATLQSVSADDVTFDLTERAVATEADAATLEADLNALVVANPILFDPGSTKITADSAAIIDRVAVISNRVGGVTIEIRGHTDTDGRAEVNQELSEGRAAAVGAALVDRGIAVGVLATAGFGGSQPIVDAAGVEDKAASRRVEFVVTVQ
ncbi:fasciclin domain-containing protein [Ilumatobacter sp.]|uniref:fasciclin domain-containing protein n=1 Tax=Ilumatobacter sp. TaxID=1967498 RepID=UPI0037516B40